MYLKFQPWVLESRVSRPRLRRDQAVTWKEPFGAKCAAVKVKAGRAAKIVF